METELTPKILKGITPDMLVSIYKPLGTGETSQVFAGTIESLKEALGVSSSVSYFSVEGLTETGDGIITEISNQIGGEISLVNAGSFSYTLTRTGGNPLTGTIRAYLSNLMENGTSSVANSSTQGIGFGDTFDLLLFDGTALSTGQSVKNGLLTIICTP